jgi:hypothetical protein
MKRSLGVLGIAGAMLLGLALTPGYGSAQDKTAPEAATPQATAKTQTFVGVMQGADEDRQWTKPVLYDQKSKANYYVDIGERKAEQYVGHKVKITGTLDKKNNIIHAKSIEAAM